MWKVSGLDEIANTMQVALERVELMPLESDRWKDRDSVFVAILSNDNVATAQVFKIVRKCAERPDNRSWIPARFEFDPIPFDSAPME